MDWTIDFVKLRQAIDDAERHMERNDFTYMPLALRLIADTLEIVNDKVETVSRLCVGSH